MTVGAGISVNDGSLCVLEETILRDVHDSIVVTPASGEILTNGAFIGVRSDHIGSRRVFPVGKLRDLKFMCLFRFKLWWMTQRMGSWGQEIPFETQFLIVEGRDGSHFGQSADERPALYVVFLPILEGDFRAVLQGNALDELEICLESGDPAVKEFNGSHLVFVGAGSDPFDVITNAVRSVEDHLQTFCHRERKKMPDVLNWFGWCTWDAFYTDVTAYGVKQGLESLQRGGVSPRFVIIDDGWQSVGMDPNSIAAQADNTANFANRLTDIKVNHNFQKQEREGKSLENSARGIQHIVSDIKEQHSVKYVFVWHALAGYWGGVKPGVADMEHYESKMAYPISSPGIQSNEQCEALELITKNGVGLVNPERVLHFYNKLHFYLASNGIDGVKIGVQNILETLGAGHGGRVRLARKYHQALEASISRNFRDNGIISCMSHNTDGLYSAKRTAVIRASDDFWPRDPASHTIHIASVAYNTIFLGEFMQPDWDMFQSSHEMAEYHGAARAVGGCAIYVSDEPGQHDFELLKQLVLPDGSILRAKLPGRPTRDCLFSDPTRDGKSLLKIWNLNDHNGVIGVFNCQGAGWCKIGKTNCIHNQQPAATTGVIRSKDVNYLPRVAHQGWNGDTIVYSHLKGELVYLDKDASLPITLNAKEYEVFTVAPVKKMSNNATFAPIGLTKMFNSGGAIKDVRYESGSAIVIVMIQNLMKHLKASEMNLAMFLGILLVSYQVNNVDPLNIKSMHAFIIAYSVYVIASKFNDAFPGWVGFLHIAFWSLLVAIMCLFSQFLLHSRFFVLLLCLPILITVVYFPILVHTLVSFYGTLTGVHYETKSTKVIMKVHGCGFFGAYSSTKPSIVQVDGREVEFKYEEDSGLLSFDLQLSSEEAYLWEVTVAL